MAEDQQSRRLRLRPPCGAVGPALHGLPPSGFPDADGPLGDLGCRANAVSRFSSESIRAARRRMEEASGSFARHGAQLGASHLRAQTQRRRDDRVLGGTTTPRSVRS